MDQQLRIDLSNQLNELSNSISIFQLSSREESWLPFINNKGYVHDNSFNISDKPEPIQIIASIATSNFPRALLSFKKVYENIIKFDKFCIDYDDKPVVIRITREVKQGEFWQLIGPMVQGKAPTYR